MPKKLLSDLTDNKIIVAGIGPGSVDYISPAALEAIQSAKVLVGGSRALEQFAQAGQVTFPITGHTEAALEFIGQNVLNGDVVVMVSGDPGYYSMLDVLKRRFGKNILKVIPSISAMQLAFARLGMSWQNAKLLSFHGRRPENSELVYKKGKIIGMLTDGKYNSSTIPLILISNDWSRDATLAICDRLSYNDERIILTTLGDAIGAEPVNHGILIVWSDKDV